MTEDVETTFTTGQHRCYFCEREREKKNIVCRTKSRRLGVHF